MSERRVCGVLGQPRATQRYRATEPDDEVGLTAAIIGYATKYGRCGNAHLNHFHILAERGNSMKAIKMYAFLIILLSTIVGCAGTSSNEVQSTLSENRLPITNLAGSQLTSPDSTQFDTDAVLKAGHELFKKKDYKGGMTLYLKAAEQGNAEAQACIGVLYESGIGGVTKNYQEAMRWFLKAAEKGNAMAQSIIGGNYLEGWGVTKNYQEAMKWYLKAAEQGDAIAQNQIGAMYFSGLGRTIDYQEAVKWFLKGAEQGEGTAQNNIGSMYQYGLGVARDYQEAMKWYLQAVEHGCPSAATNIAYLYRNGLGVARDNRLAGIWYLRAGDIKRIINDNPGPWRPTVQINFVGIK